MRRHRGTACMLVVGFLALGCAAQQSTGEQAAAAEAELPRVDLSGGPNFPLEAHLEQADIVAGSISFEELFDAGGDLFHTPMNGHDGIGAKRLPDGSEIRRFSFLPPGGGVLAPISVQSCGSCHNMPHGAAGGLAHTHVAFDPNMDGAPPFNIRSTTSTFGNGLQQLLAQEITEDLQAIRAGVEAAALASPGEPVSEALLSKGLSYGMIAATADAAGEVAWDLSGLEGIDPDLVVRPIGSKGHITIIRSIAVGASGLMSLQPEELVRKIQAGAEAEGNPVPPDDLDGDGVERELSVSDVTALVAYGAAQETPHSVSHLAELGMVAAPSVDEVARIEQGRELFAAAGCVTCHVPELRLDDTVFEEPTLAGNGNYYDTALAAIEPTYDPERPLRFDLATEAEEPRVEPHPDGGAIVRLYGDLKRHDMGRQMAEPAGPQPSIAAVFAPLTIDGEMVLIPPSVFLTSELWGVGNTGPWLHDGRAATLDEAVRWHGEDEPPAVGEPGRSEAQESRDAYVALGGAEREALLTFLRSLRTFAPPHEE